MGSLLAGETWKGQSERVGLMVSINRTGRKLSMRQMRVLGEARIFDDFEKVPPVQYP